MSTVILGAGISGLAAAYFLHSDPSREYSVFEQLPRAGGFCQTDSRDGFHFDVVSHVLHFRSLETHKLAEGILNQKLNAQSRSAWIYFKNRYVPYPFQSNLGYLPFRDRTSCLTGYLRAWSGAKMGRVSDPRNLEEWIQRHMGEGIGRCFMRPYNRKLWGKESAELSVDWLGSFVPRASLRDVISSVTSKRVGVAGYNSTFYYPASGGVQALVDGIVSRIRPVRLNERVVRVDLDSKLITFEDGREVSYDRLISTLPLTKFAHIATGIPTDVFSDASKLQNTTLLSLIFGVSANIPHSRHWIYFPESKYPFFRLVFPSNISASLAPANCGIVAAEISDPDPAQLDRLESQTRTHLINLGFVQKSSDIRFTSRYHFPYAYPIHDLGRESSAKRILEFLKSRDVWSIGRFGAWRYSSIDDALTEARATVAEIRDSQPVWIGRSQSAARADLAG